MTMKITQQEIDLIDRAFSKRVHAQILTKDVRGRIIAPGTTIVNNKTFQIKSFSGRVLSRNKWVVPRGGRQQLVAKKGQRFDDIPIEQREKVRWSEQDFI
jgi:hypothetical protein